MFHSSGFAIAAGVVGVASAAYGAYATSQATKQQGAAMGKSTKAFKKQQQKLEKLVMSIDPTIKTPEFDPQAVSKDLGANWGQFRELANQATDNAIAQIEKIQPGAAEAREKALQELNQWTANLGQQYAQLQQAQPFVDEQQNIVTEMMRGGVPAREQQRVMQSIAQSQGAAYNPFSGARTAGFQVPQATFSQQILEGSEARRLAGLQLAPMVTEQQRGIAGTAIGLSEGIRGIQSTMMGWQELANMYRTSETQVAGVGIQLQGLREQAAERQMRAQQYTVANRFAQAEALGGLAQGTYAANMNQMAQQSSAARQNIEAQMGVGQALAGGLGGLSNARMAQMRAGQGGGGGFPGGFNYEQVYGKATYGGAPSGWGNFDYGSGTGA
jgi:hypothetical protein